MNLCQEGVIIETNNVKKSSTFVSTCKMQLLLSLNWIIVFFIFWSEVSVSEIAFLLTALSDLS